MLRKPRLTLGSLGQVGAEAPNAFIQEGHFVRAIAAHTVLRHIELARERFDGFGETPREQDAHPACEQQRGERGQSKDGCAGHDGAVVYGNNRVMRDAVVQLLVDLNLERV